MIMVGDETFIPPFKFCDVPTQTIDKKVVLLSLPQPIGW